MEGLGSYGAVYRTVSMGKFQTDWFKVLPEEAETAFRLGFKS